MVAGGVELMVVVVVVVVTAVKGTHQIRVE